MITLSNKIIFIHIPKTGGTSVSNSLSLRRSMGGRHMTAIQTRDMYGQEIFDNAWKFTFIRNPWDRMVSVFHYYKHGLEQENKQIRQGLANVEFDEFLKEHKTLFQWSKSLFKNQLDWITDNKGNVMVDYIARFENYAKESEFILERSGIGTSVRHDRKSKRDSDYKTYYTNETKDIVAKIYNKDIEFFNYDF